jgi:hypothetical protein
LKVKKTKENYKKSIMKMPAENFEEQAKVPDLKLAQLKSLKDWVATKD